VEQEAKSGGIRKPPVVADRNAQLFGTSQYEEFRSSRSFFFISMLVSADDPTL
jgi:hypothetical protein